jgi:hypothetical protein
MPHPCGHATDIVLVGLITRPPNKELKLTKPSIMELRS